MPRQLRWLLVGSAPCRTSAAPAQCRTSSLALKHAGRCQPSCKRASRSTQELRSYPPPRAGACGSAMEARRRALQRNGCSDTSTQLLATTSLFCCGIVTYDAGPARTGVAASRIGDARCCDGCARCRVGSAAGCCPHASRNKTIWPAGPRCARQRGPGARALGSNLAGNAVSQHRLCVIDVITSIHTACRLHETRQEGRVPTERPLKAQARVPPRRALRGSQR